MRIYSLSKILAIPLVAAAAYLLSFQMSSYSPYSLYIIVPVILLVSLYIFHGQIDHWYLEKNPIPLDKEVKDWFIKHAPYYNAFSERERVAFENRISLYIEGREFKSVGTNELREVPYDISAIIASQCIKLTSGIPDYLLGDLDRIYIYKHPFPSPQYQFLHTVEVEMEDGMLVLALDYAIQGVLYPDRVFNVTMYGYASAFVQIYPDMEYPEVSGLGFDQVSNITGNLTKEVIEATTGFDKTQLLPLHITLFFDFPEAYKAVYPIEYQSFKKVFRD